MAVRLIALGLEIRLDHQRPAAFGFFRPRRAVRRPRPLAEFRAALAQQRLQRLHGGGGAGDAAKGRDGVLVRGAGVRPRRRPRNRAPARARRPRPTASRPRVPGPCRRSPPAAPRRTPAVDLRARCAAEKSARRSNELSAGGFSPVCEPGPAVPWPMPGLSSSASAGSVGGRSGRDALARVGRAGSFFECLAGSRAGLPCGAFGCSGAFAIAEIWSLGYDRKRAEHGSAPQILMRWLAAHPSNGMGAGARPATTGKREGTMGHARRGLTRRQMLKASAGALPLIAVTRPPRRRPPIRRGRSRW